VDLTWRSRLVFDDLMNPGHETHIQADSTGYAEIANASFDMAHTDRAA